jgi:hypoxanthine phosphoribosyltransferase
MEVLIEESKINRSVRALAHIITEEHRNSGNMLPPVMICVLNGAFPFFSDLVKDIGVDCEIDFIRAKSNERRDNLDGVSITLDLEIDLKGKRVYIVDGMIGNDQTMFEVLGRVNDKMPAEVQIVTLVHRKGNEFPVDYFCFEIGDEFVVGYGFDNMSLKRNYRNIYKK